MTNHYTSEVKAHADILKVIGNHVSLERRGDTYVGLCPFHQEDSPSFTVYTKEDDPHYRCYGCDTYGDVIAFRMRSKSLDFSTALQSLAKE